MRPLTTFGVVAAAIVLLGACTTAFGSSAEELPPPDAPSADSGVDATRDAVGQSEAAAIDAGRDVVADAGESFPPPCDMTIDLNTIDCSGKTTTNCASNFATSPSGVTANDLIDCTGGLTRCVRHCPNGCAASMTGRPDQCDDCFGRPDGFYCGRDLRGYDPRLEQMLITCKNGMQSEQALCGDGVNGRCQSVCTRTSPPPVVPSCCVTK